MLNSNNEFNTCYIPRLRVANQDVINEMEVLEEQDSRKIKETQKEDSSWEKNKDYRKTVWGAA